MFYLNSLSTVLIFIFKSPKSVLVTKVSICQLLKLIGILNFLPKLLKVCLPSMNLLHHSDSGSNAFEA